MLLLTNMANIIGLMAMRRSNLQEQLRQAVRDSGQSLNQLAERTGVDSGRLSRFMRGERDLTLSATTRICEALGLQLCKTENGDKLVPVEPKQPRGRKDKE
jgi:transcriptional regulator with XRE-family HTH domain